MNKAQFEREKEYGAAIAIANRLLRRGLITQAECRELAAAFSQKYRPLVSSEQSPQAIPSPKKKWTVKN